MANTNQPPPSSKLAKAWAEFSWDKAIVKMLVLQVLSGLTMLGFVWGGGFGGVHTRSGSVVEPAYILVAWAGLQGCYVVYNRATGVKDQNFIVQSPRYIPLLVISQALGVVVMAICAFIGANMHREQHALGSLVALIPENGAAWLAFVLYTVSMATWPTAWMLYLLIMSARRKTIALGLILGIPGVVVTLIGGLFLGWHKFNEEFADADAAVALWLPIALGGLAAYAASLAWLAWAKRCGHIGPPPDKPGMFTGAVRWRD